MFLYFQSSKPARAGIVGIERNIKQKHTETNKDISVAFEDLSKLMNKVRDCLVYNNYTLPT